MRNFDDGLSFAGYREPATSREQTVMSDTFFTARQRGLGERLRALAPTAAKVLGETLPSSSSTSPVLEQSKGRLSAGYPLSQEPVTMPASPVLSANLPRKPVPREVEKMVNVLEQRVMHFSEAETARMRMLTDHAQRLAEGIQAMRAAREIQDEQRQKELKVVEGHLMMDIDKVAKVRQEIARNCEAAGESHLAEAREELQKEQSRREAVHDQYAQEVGEEVRRLDVLLEEQRSARLEYGERIVGSLEGEFQKVHDAIVAEQKQRFEAEGTMLRMVEDVCTRVRSEIQQERDQRQAVQGKLLGLLEETTSRIEVSFSFCPQ
eukprot:TRINITY_DN6545_c0_g1_i1.p1 TRINITY_DN6545_c0_g1~~TRINITY_DN6545_c0_g1_i1.p1  ORF type:complete len:321 (+),score=73.38 TRINITY_DN6545_c0_g1_i1:96-1058(+)